MVLVLLLAGVRAPFNSVAIVLIGLTKLVLDELATLVELRLVYPFDLLMSKKNKYVLVRLLDPTNDWNDKDKGNEEAT